MTDFELTSIATLGGAVFLGALLGAGYFVVLWQTLRRLPQSRRPAMLLIPSLLLRLTLLLTAFYLILKLGQWDHLMASLLGFILVRVLVARRLNPAGKDTVVQSNSETPP